MKVIEISKDNLDSFNVLYDAISKHPEAGGVAGLRKVTKLLNKLDEIGCLIAEKDEYVLNNADSKYNLFLDDDEISSIKGWFDAVKWHPMKAKKIVTAYDLLESAKEVKLETVKKD